MIQIPASQVPALMAANANLTDDELRAHYATALTRVTSGNTVARHYGLTREERARRSAHIALATALYRIGKDRGLDLDN